MSQLDLSFSKSNSKFTKNEAGDSYKSVKTFFLYENFSKNTAEYKVKEIGEQDI